MLTRMPAEWEEQDGVLLAWPHEGTDWAPRLPRVRRTFLEIAKHISRFENVIIVGPTIQQIRRECLKAGIETGRLFLVEAPTNDTWARDFGPISVFRNGKPFLLDFMFNGWGGKFSASLDDQITKRLFQQNLFPNATRQNVDMILEGGSIETDGGGTLLTTSRCLLNPNRNCSFDREGIEARLSALLGVNRFLWLRKGFLVGDDTDAHVDILARFCDENTIAYTHCEDEEDEHFPVLLAMKKELEGFRRRDGKPYKLIPLPIPKPLHNEKGERLPASYANFLIINNAVLAPVYGDENDGIVLEKLKKAFPGREITGIDCRELIRQGGSLHCMAMQLPAGVMK